MTYAASSQIWRSRAVDASARPCRRHEPTAMRAGRVWLAAHARQRGGVAAHGARHTSPAEHRPAAATHDRDWPAADARQRCGLGPAARAAAQHRPAQAAARACRRATYADGPGRVAARAKAPNADPLRPLVVRVGAQPLPVAALAWLCTVRGRQFRRCCCRTAAIPIAPVPPLPLRSRPWAAASAFPADTESEQL